MTQCPADKLVDVEEFFIKTTASYLEFEQSLNSLFEELRTVEPESIVKQCAKIQAKKEALDELNRETLAIIELASEGIEQYPFINDYRIAFNRAITSCNNVHSRLLSIRREMEKQV